MEPVGMTNASATKPRKSSAKITAIATDSTVSRQPPSAGGASLEASLAGAGFFDSRSGLVLLISFGEQLSLAIQLDRSNVRRQSFKLGIRRNLKYIAMPVARIL